MSHKKCPIGEAFLESIYEIFLFLFCIVNQSCLCTKFWIWMSKVSHLNFFLISLWRTYLLQIPTSVCVIFIVVSPAMPFSTSNFPMCHNFLIPSQVYIFLSEPYLSFNPFFFLRQFNHCLTGNAFYHIQHIITNAICQWLASLQHNKRTPCMANQ